MAIRATTRSCFLRQVLKGLQRFTGADHIVQQYHAPVLHKRRIAPSR
jgi:hypothetical protein